MSEGDATHLDRILTAKRAELAAVRRGAVTAADVDAALRAVPPSRDFVEALRRSVAPAVIAEFKRASPSAGAIREGADVTQIVQAYDAAGATAISVLTDQHFEGSLDDLRAARAATELPILRKDFIIERSQLLDARQAGADAVLLIVAALPAPTLRPMIDFAHDVGLTVLCEAHDADEVDRAMSAGARLVGVNSRDLRTFEVDISRAIELRTRVPASFTYVAESGIESADDVRRMREAGVDAILVGTRLMAAENPGDALRSLMAP